MTQMPLTGRFVTKTYYMATGAGALTKGDLMMFNNAGALSAMTSEAGRVTYPIAGFYMGSNQTTSYYASGPVLTQVQVPLGDTTFISQTSGSFTSAYVGVEFGVSTSGHDYVGFGNTDIAPFVLEKIVSTTQCVFSIGSGYLGARGQVT